MLDRTQTVDVHFVAGELNHALRQVRHAISTEETRYYLCGVYLHYVKDEGWRFVATDGHRLALATVKQTDSAFNGVPGVILPPTFVNEVIKATNKRRDANRGMRLDISATRVGLNLHTEAGIEAIPIDGTFPDYQRVIPQYKNAVHVFELEAETMRTQVAAVSAFRTANKQTPCTKLTFVPEKLTLSTAIEDGAATAHLKSEAVSEKAELQIGFNGDYLGDILSTFQDRGTVVMHSDDPGSPTVFLEKHDSNPTIHVLMPMRV